MNWNTEKKEKIRKYTYDVVLHFRTAVNVIKKSHKLVFNNKGDKGNRKRLREFYGFRFDKNTKKYKPKLDEIKELFSVSDLAYFSKHLTARIWRETNDLISNICTGLTSFDFLQENEN